ncbi:hypothetical protein ACIQMO_22695 [Streptomyces sp. NPDC091406]|uniref:hypothetical protein n=1 Tax=unclassified Streptomyces TaxID=2593676 RepID=UPI00381AE629
MNSAEYFLRGDVDKGVEYFKGGASAAADGLVSGGLEKNIGGGGRHRKPSAVATVVDFSYTPPGSKREPGDDRVVAPAAPPKVRYR